MNTAAARADLTNVSEIVAAHWPYDGPHTAESVLSALVAAAALIRHGNAATLSAPDALTVQDVDHAAASLALLLHRLPQLVEQLAARMDGLAATPGLFDDRRADDPAAGAESARAAATRLRAMRDPIGQAENLAVLLQAVTSHIGTRA